MRQQLRFKVKLLSQRGEEEKSHPLLLALETASFNVVSKITHAHARRHMHAHTPCSQSQTTDEPGTLYIYTMAQFSDPQLTPVLIIITQQRISLACPGHICVFLAALAAAGVSCDSPEALHSVMSVKSTPHHAVTDIKAFDSNLLPNSVKSLHSTACYLMRWVAVSFVCCSLYNRVNIYVVVNISII